jgi:hypothetical protein
MVFKIKMLQIIEYFNNQLYRKTRVNVSNSKVTTEVGTGREPASEDPAFVGVTTVTLVEVTRTTGAVEVISTSVVSVLVVGTKRLEVSSA